MIVLVIEWILRAIWSALCFVFDCAFPEILFALLERLAKRFRQRLDSRHTPVAHDTPAAHDNRLRN